MEFFSLLFGNDMMDEIMKFTNPREEKLKASLKDWKVGYTSEISQNFVFLLIN